MTGHGDATPLGDTTHTYSTGACDLLTTTVQADIASAFDFASDGQGAEGFTQANQDVLSSTAPDEWGNPVETCAGAESIATTGTTSFAFLTTTATWDRGLGALEVVTAPDGESTTVGYDGLGRLTYVKPSGTCGTPVPTHRFEYELAPGGQPVSVVYSYEEPSCTAIGSTLQLRSRSYVDGLGRARAAALRAEGTDRWVQSGVVTFTARGTASKAYQEVFLSAADPSIAEAVAIPPPPNRKTEARYDAFGRVVVSIAEDDAQYVTVHHALSTEAWDPLDLGSDDTFEDTPAISRTDGHGRVIDQVLINRQPGSSTDEYHRLFTASGRTARSSRSPAPRPGAPTTTRPSSRAGAPAVRSPTTPPAGASPRPTRTPTRPTGARPPPTVTRRACPRASTSATVRVAPAPRRSSGSSTTSGFG